MPKITIDIEDRSGNKKSSGPITTAFELAYNEPVADIGTYSFTMPASDAKSEDLLLQKRLVRIYLDTDEVFLGIVEKLERRLGASGVMLLVVSGRSYLADLTEVSMQFAEFNGITSLTGFLLQGRVWSADPTNGDTTTSAAYYVRLGGESIYNALKKLAEKLGDYYWYRPATSGNDRYIVWVNKGTHANSGIRAVQGSGFHIQTEKNTQICLIQEMTKADEGFEIFTRLYPWGSGQGRARLSLVGATGASVQVREMYGTGTTVTVNTKTAHNLSTSDKFAVHQSTDFNSVEETVASTPSSTQFTYSSDDGDAVTASTISFADNSPSADTISDSANGLAVFDGYDKVVVSGSGSGNDGTFKITGATASTITLDASEGLVNEAAGSSITILGARADGWIDPIDANNIRVNSVDNYIEDYDQIYGVDPYASRATTVQFRDIEPLDNTDAALLNAKNWLLNTAKVWLDRHSTERNYYTLSVTGLGVTAINPGQTINVLYEDDLLSIDEDLIVLDIQHRVSGSGVRMSRLTVSDNDLPAVTDQGYLATVVEAERDYLHHAQMGSNVWVYSYGNEFFDETYDAELFFVLSEVVTLVDSVILYYRVDPLRSPFSSSTSDSGSGHTHEINVANSTTGTTVYFAGTGGPPPVGDFRTSGGGTVNASSTGASHTHDVDIDFTTGITEDTGANTAGEGNVTIQVNGASTTNSASSYSGDWYSLDLTPDVVDPVTLRPEQAANTISITAPSSKRGRLTAHVEIRAIIQSIAYS